MKIHNNQYSLIISLLLLNTMSGCTWQEEKQEGTSMAKAYSETQTTNSGLRYIILEPPQNQQASSPSTGQYAVVHYTGWLYDENASENKGKKFDSSLDRGQPFVFPLGLGRVIKGWDEGVAMMKVGEKRRLIIPSELGYGERGAGAAIPPHAMLLFDVELLDILK